MQKASSWVTIWPPITLAVFGTIARAFGEAKLLDGNVEKLSMHELLEDIDNFNPDIFIALGNTFEDTKRIRHDTI